MRVVSGEPEAAMWSFDAMNGKGPALALLLPFAISAGQMELWALAAAIGAAFLASLAYLLRCHLGLVKPPPPEEDRPH